MTNSTDPKTSAEELSKASPSPSKQEVWEECERIALSDEFRMALAQQRLLRYLVSETLEGRGGNLKEYSVGLEVFQRSQDFDPRTDAIVRVTVGQLRRRLTAYYSGLGAGDPVMIQIPKGHYSAEFVYTAALLSGEPIPAEASRGIFAPAVAAHAPLRFRSGPWAIVGLMLVALAVGSASTWLVMRHRSARFVDTSGAAAFRQSILWSRFLHGETDAIGLVGIASTVAIGPMIVRVPLVNDDASIRDNKTIQKLSSIFGKPAFAYNVYTGIGEALAVSELQQAFTRSSLNLSVMASREARWQDLHADNVIFISSLHFHDLHSELERRKDFTAEEDAEGGLRILNHAPKNGEQAVYSPSGNYVQPSVDYALVSLTPGTVPTHSIMTVGGIGTLGTAGAMQYITERQSLAELNSYLKRNPGPSTDRTTLQILLRVDIVDNQVVSVHYVTHHWIVPRA